MFKTVPILLSVLLLFSQTNVESAEESQDIWDLAHQLLQELIDFAETSVDGATFVVTSYYAGQVNSFYGYASSSLSKELEKFNTTITQELNYLKELANNASVDIQQCLDGKEEELDKLSHLALNNYRRCADGFYKRVSQNSQKSVAILNNTLSNIYGIKNSLNNCDQTDTQCIIDVIGKISDEDDAFPITILNITDHIYDLLIGFELIVTGCVQIQVTNTTQRGEQIIADISECVHHIIG